MIYLLSCIGYFTFLIRQLYGQVIGDNNLIMGSCHIAHDCKVGNYNIFANNTLFAGHVVVEVSPKLVLFCDILNALSKMKNQTWT